MIASGSTQLSYWAASARNTNTMASANTNSAVLPVMRSCKAISVHSKPWPGSSTLAARFSITLSDWPVETPGGVLPCSGTDTYML